MWRLLAVFAAFVVLVFGSGPSQSSAQAPVKSQSLPQLEVFQYESVDNPPIPVGEIIEFIERDGRQVFRWNVRRGSGYVERHLRLDGVRNIFFIERLAGASRTEYRPPRVGDVGVIVRYDDHLDNAGRYGPDGVVDEMTVRRYRAWEPSEVALLDMAHQFQRELEEAGLVIATRGGDCPAKGFLVDGRPAELGPYGNSYFLPKKGGVIAPYWEGGCARSSVAVTGQEIAAKPGDFVLSLPYRDGNRGSIESLAQADPWQFCGFLEDMRPQWSPPFFVPAVAREKCRIYDGDDRTLPGRMAKLGFWETARTPQVGAEYEKGATLYERWEEGRVKLDLPPYRWAATDQIELGGVVYKAAVEYSEWYGYSPVLTGAASRDNIRLFRWESPFVVVPNKDLGRTTEFDWKNYRVFRVVRSGWSEATIHEAVWE